MSKKKIIVAGLICLDLLPNLTSVADGEFYDNLKPGRLIQSGDLTLRAGGVVSNTGLCLHRLGFPVRMIGKIGDDLFGRIIQEKIDSLAPHLSESLVVDPSSHTSYGIIIDPPGCERSFIHYSGANQTFYASDLARATLQEGDIFHFGYPTLMRSIYRGDGAELVSILQRARRAGLTTSLDVSLPDLTSEAGQADWFEILTNSLPLVDIFMPNAAELIFMLKRDLFDLHLKDSEDFCPAGLTPELLHDLSSSVIKMGTKVVLIKLGYRGLYLRTAGKDAWQKAGRGAADLDESWHNRELWAPAFKVDVKETIGAGDAASAGFLAGMLEYQNPELALVMGAAAGACSIEGLNATDTLTPCEELLARVNGGWEVIPTQIDNPGWKKEGLYGIWQNE